MSSERHDIEKQKQKELNFFTVEDLLKEILRHKNPRKIEINFDGYMFKTWNVTLWNPSADDFRRDNEPNKS